MRSARRSLRALAALVTVVALAAVGTACSDDGGETSSPPTDPGGGTDEAPEEDDEPPRLDIDPRSFYENYQPADEAATAAGGGAGAPTTGAPSPSTRAPAGADRSTTAFDGSTQAESGSAAPEAQVAPGDGQPVPPPGSPPGPGEPGFEDDNTFTDPGTNPFVTAADDPESTFGLDVDTGSYAIGRTWLTEGLLPQPASVRTEEWVNAFGYDYDRPEDGDLAVRVDGAPAPFAEDGTELVRVGVQGRDVARDDRPEAALTLVVDTSGSMDIRERLGLVQSTLALLALELRDTDTVSVVTFDDSAEVLLPPTPAAEAETIVRSIGQLVPSGGTNMDAGLREGYAQARAAFRPDAINTVILASDGVANLGITGTDPLSELVRSEGEEGISLVTVGFGMGNYNDELMEQLADRGDGFYSYVDTYEEAERLFTQELTSTLTIIARDTRTQVAFDPDVVSSYRLVGYENRAIADESFRDDTVDAGELGAGHTVTALYEVRRAEDADDDADLGTVTVRHLPTGSDEATEQSVDIERGDVESDLAEASTDLRLAGAVAAFAEVLAGHQVTVDRGTTLDQLAELVDGILEETGEPRRPPSDEGGGGEPGEVDPAVADADVPPVDVPIVDESGRPGAAELAHLIDLARRAAPPSPDPEPEPGPGPVPLPGPRPVPTPR
jgi:Ca-activated chloride channel family protein